MNLNKAKALCRALPAATEDVKWESNLVFSVGGKMFAVTDTSDKASGISFKVDDDRFLSLTDREGIIPAPYLARAKWTHIQDIKTISDAELSELLNRSYELVFSRLTKTLQRELRGSNGAT